MLPFRRLGAAPLRGPMRRVSAAAPSRSLLGRNHSLPAKCVFSVSNEWLSATPWRLPLVAPFVPLARRFVTVATAAFSHNGALLPDNKPRNTRVLIFDVEGNPTTQTMTRAEVLRITREAAASTLEDAASAPTPPPRVRTPRGARSNFDGIIDVQRVHARDIRQLDSAFAVRSEPSVEVRDQAILVNADPIRAIIMRHRCVVFLREDDLTLQPMLEDVFHTAAAPDETIVAYEFQALEALLGALCRYYHGEFNRVAPAITTSLSRLTAGQPTAGELDTLRSFKNTMNEFQSRVDGVRRALMATLNNEEDLRLLYLSKLHEDRSLLGNVWSYDSEEAEVLIENYLQEIYALQTNATLMQQRIQNTETVVKLRLDAMRNYLLGTNILFSVAGISISLGTFVAGVFGMNLVSGVEEAHGWFLAVTASSVVLMGVSGWVTVRFFKRKGIFGSIQQVKSLTDKKRATSDSPVKKTDTA